MSLVNLNEIYDEDVNEQQNEVVNEQHDGTVKTFNHYHLQDFSLDDVSSEDDDFKPLSGIIKRMIENNETSANLPDSPQNIDK